MASFVSLMIVQKEKTIVMYAACRFIDYCTIVGDVIGSSRLRVILSEGGGKFWLASVISDAKEESKNPFISPKHHGEEQSCYHRSPPQHY
jgi:hypothetical protein